MPPSIRLLISKLFIKSIIIFQILISALIFVVKMGENIAKYSVKDDISIANLIYITLLYIPSIIITITPFIFLFASFYTLRKLTTSEELTIIKSFGLSIWQILKPLYIITILWSLMIVCIFIPISSTLLSKYRMLQSRSFDTTETNTAYISNNNQQLVSYISPSQKYIISADRILTNKDQSIFLYDISILLIENDILKQMLQSKSGILQNNILTLKNGTIKTTDNTILSNFDTLDLIIILKQTKLLNIVSQPENIIIWNLPTTIISLKNLNLDTKKYEVYFYDIITLPIFLITMLLLSTVFAITNVRQTKAILNIIYMLLFGFILFIFINILNSFGITGVIYPMLAVCTAKIISLLVCLTLLIYTEGL